MKWIGISGSWREVNATVEADVRNFVSVLAERGDGVVTGGALGVDSFALDEMLRHDKHAERIKVFLPTTLERYAAHYRARAAEGVITPAAAERLITLLQEIARHNPSAIIERPDHDEVNQDTYFDRITSIVEASDELAAFHVNGSEGTQNAIEKALSLGVPVVLHKTYLI